MPKGVYGSVAPHGTLTRYTYHGCRCRICKDAQRDYYRDLTGARSMDEYLADVEPPHGSEGRYTSRRWRCRCEECREAARVARARRRAAAHAA